MIRVTCVIPAHNEAARIAGVLAAVIGHSAIDHVLVVDDGSSDDTAARARAMGVEVLSLQPNRGKSAALGCALSQVTTSHVLLLDADLLGLTPGDVARLLAPVRAGQSDVALSLRGNAPRVWHWIGVDYITGERVLPMALLRPLLPQMAALPRFGLEVFMNTHIQAARLRVAIVEWPAVASPSKAQKRGWIRGIRADIGMMRDIFRTISPMRALQQMLYLRGAGPLGARLSRQAARLRPDRDLG